MVVHDICAASDLNRFSDKKLIVIDFHADWCRPCKRLKPHFTALSDKYADGAHFLRSNVETSSELADRYTVRTLPTVIVITQTGTLLDRVVGFKPVVMQECLEKCLQGGEQKVVIAPATTGNPGRRVGLFSEQNFV